MPSEDLILRKLDHLQADVSNLQEEVRVGFAKMPHAYVPRTEMNTLKREAQAARRWASGLGVPSLLGIIGLFTQFL